MKVSLCKSAVKSMPAFNAQIIKDRKKIFDALKQDKKLKLHDFKNISVLIDNIDGFSSMEEKPIVEIEPFVNKGQVRLVTNVFDSTKKIYLQVSERSVRKLASSEDFRKKYINSVKMLIKNTEVISRDIDKIANTILKAKNITGITFDRCSHSKTLENVSRFIKDFSFIDSYNNALLKNYNPTARIINTIKNINKNGATNIGLSRVRNIKVTTYITSIFNGNKKMVLLSDLFKIPVAKKLTI